MFLEVKFSIYLNRRVFVMNSYPFIEKSLNVSVERFAQLVSIILSDWNQLLESDPEPLNIIYCFSSPSS